MITEFYSLNIASVERLTKDAVAVRFNLPADLKETFQYRQGQHLTLRAMINGQDVRRSYSICESAKKQSLTVAIKRIDNGLFSNFANDQLKAGMAIDVMPPHGHFYIEHSAENRKHYLMIAAGSGVTPMLSHMETILETEPESTVSFIYGNKSTPMMMFRERLSFLKNRYLTRLNWVNLFTLEENEATIFNGRISAKKLIELDQARIVSLGEVDDVFLCGPEAMIMEIKNFLQANQFKPENIHYELFFAGASNEQLATLKANRAEQYGQKVSKVSVKVAGRKTILELASDGASILDAAMENGADVPYSCKGGVCATCKAKVIKGKVEMDLNHSLTAQEVEEGMVLTCQAHPVSDEVELDFDINQ